MSEPAADIEIPATARDHGRRGGRSRPRSIESGAFDQPPFRQLKIPFTPTKIISDDELESIHNASLRVLQEIGVDVLHDGAREIMKAAGADVRPGSQRVHFDKDMILEYVGYAPSEFTLHARNPAHNVRFGG
ncbi:TPA: methyltransferase, partial [Escherichia coli]|nr:methyltransferase [Escherichia coli]